MIFVEGVNDKTFLIAMNIPGRRIHKLSGRGNVSNRLSKSTGCKAMVDEDPHEGTMPHYFASLKELKKNDFRIQLVDAQKDNLVLVLRPDFERWFLSFCQREKIELKGISPKPSLFKGDIARPSGKKKFTQIVQDHLGHQTLVEIKEILS